MVAGGLALPEVTRKFEGGGLTGTLSERENESEVQGSIYYHECAFSGFYIYQND